MTTDRKAPTLNELSIRIENIEKVLDHVINAVDALIEWALNGQVLPDGVSIVTVGGRLAADPKPTNDPAEDNNDGKS